MTRILTLVFGIMIVASLHSTAQTTLNPGEIAVIAINADNPDQFAFVALVPLDTSTEITFTDSGWLAAGGFRANEGAVKFTAAAPVARGDVVVFSGVGGEWTTANDPFVGNNGLALSTSGDQIIAFQGLSSAPVLIYAAQTNSTAWQADATASTNSALPTGLVDGVSAVAVGSGPGAGDEWDNSQYTGIRADMGGSVASALALISDAANWTGSNSAITIDTTRFGNVPVELMSISID